MGPTPGIVLKWWIIESGCDECLSNFACSQPCVVLACSVCVCALMFTCSFVQEYGVARLWKVVRFNFLLPCN